MSSQAPWETTQGASAVVNMRHRSPPRNRAMTNPSQPHALFPARRPSTVHTSDIYFVPPLKNNRPTTSSSTSPRHSPSTPTHTSATYLHPFHRTFASPPPIPPKPVELRQDHLGNQSPAENPATPGTQTGPTEEDELAIALALSQTESTRRQTALKRLDSQEEEDLARALAESLRTTSSAVHQPSEIILPVPQETITPTQSPPPDDAATPTSNSGSLESRTKDQGRLEGRVVTKSMPVLTSAAVTPSDPVGDPCASDEAIARRIAEDGRLSPKSPGSTGVRWTDGDTVSTYTSFSRSHSVPPTSALITNDEKYARQLAEQEAGMSNTARARSRSAMAYVGLRTSNMSDLPPPYEVSSSGTVANDSSNSNHSSSSSRVIGNGSAGAHLLSPGSDISSTRFPRILPITPPDQSTGESPLSPGLMDRTLSSTSLSSPLASPGGYEDLLSPGGGLNPYVTDELLKGISIGFDPPLMSAQVTTWQNPLPTVISLPYGRSVPLHIQATSWRHALKLLARLPGTAIQPTVEAMAVTKIEHRLRTVVQFVKPHLASTEWRTILWFTLEHPVPDDVTGRSRYANDVNVLPWSYTFSAVPQLLRGGVDSQLSKTYTIPTSSSFPFPTLPITFPDLAMYLHGALEFSRRHINDSSSGVRKLVKITEVCYPPNTDADETDDPERRRVGGLLKNLIGRGNRRRGGNEDTYDLVTPFVANEWG